MWLEQIKLGSEPTVLGTTTISTWEINVVFMTVGSGPYFY